MDPLFVATPPAHSITAPLQLWPELAGQRLRPLLVSAFGDIYVELSTGEVVVADPLELTCQQLAGSTDELQSLFSDAAWAKERLLTDVVLLAQEQGNSRPVHQVFSVAPHPCLGGTIRTESLVPMALEVWHQIATQLKGQTQPGA